MDTNSHKNLRFNAFVNIMDGGFFLGALGFASFVTIIPLFVSTMTDSPVLIGLIPAIHVVGWQLPQLFTARYLARVRRYKPWVLIMTIPERVPFAGLALIAWLSPGLDRDLALWLTFLLLIWQGFGGGFTAIAWQSMIGKVIPGDVIGSFFGFQAAFGNVISSAAAILAGYLLETLPSPLDFTLCFALASIFLVISWVFLALTREEPNPIPQGIPQNIGSRKNILAILKKDANFRWFLTARMLFQLSTMAFAFYTVYSVRDFGVSEYIVGILTGVLLGVQIIANPVMGWLGDKLGHRVVLEWGILATMLSAGLAILARDVAWFYLVFALVGVSYVSSGTSVMAMTLEFGAEEERPAYIGLANTLVAPSTFLAPLLGGFVAEQFGYPVTFYLSIAFGVVTAVVIRFFVKDPKVRKPVQELVTEQSLRN